MATIDDNFFETDLIEDDAADKVEPTEQDLEIQEFEAGLNRTQGIEATEEIEPEIEPQQALIAGYTEDQLRAAIDKANRFDELEDRFSKTHDKAFGKIGQLEQLIKSQKQVSKEAFNRLSSEYFDDDGNFAELMAEALSGVALFQGGTDTVNADIESLRAEITNQREAVEKKILTVLHPDWADYTADAETETSKEFWSWAKSLRNQKAWDFINNAQSADDVSKALTEFKKFKTLKEEKAAEKQRRLEDATPIRGGSTNRSRIDKSAEAEFLEGLRSTFRT